MEIISRDRAGVYAEGARLGAPNAIQVADRWHPLRAVWLTKNIGDALERFLSRRRDILKVAPLVKGAKETSANDPAQPQRVPVACRCARNCAPGVCAQTEPTRAEQEKQCRRAWRYGRYEQVQECVRQGTSVAGIARFLSLDRKTVRRFVQSETFPERLPRPRLPSLLDEFKPDIRRRWDQGSHNAAEIMRELKGIGYTGGYAIVKDYVTTLRGAEPMPSDCAMSLKPEERNASDEAILDSLGERYEPFRRFQALARAFFQMMRRPKCIEVETGSDVFTAWLTEAVACDVAEIRVFAKGLGRDRAAVEAAIALPWSNGPVEGAIQRLKVIKRQMYGRANFDLLRRRVLEPV